MLMALPLALLLAGAASQAAPVRPSDPCRLLTGEEIRTIQAVPLRESKPSIDRSKSLTFDQCVFATNDVTRSVSLTVISGSERDAAHGYWNRTFHPQRTEAQLKAATRKKELPRAVDAGGEEAFWTGDRRTGALYILKDDVVLRISVGGVRDEEERIRRSTAIARIAIDRLSAVSNPTRK
jgi:hypothetical protein